MVRLGVIVIRLWGWVGKIPDMKTLIQIAIVAVIIAIVAFAGPACCTQPNETTRVLASQGYTEIKITGWRPFAKSENDFFSTGFQAKSANGSFVTGAVTSGIFKGHTVRLD